MNSEGPLLWRQNRNCWICGRELLTRKSDRKKKMRDAISKDHVFPLSLSGPITDILLAHKHCNHTRRLNEVPACAIILLAAMYRKYRSEHGFAHLLKALVWAKRKVRYRCAPLGEDSWAWEAIPGIPTSYPKRYQRKTQLYARMVSNRDRKNGDEQRKPT